MFYIKLETDQDDLNLVITQREALYRGDNLNQKIRYLIPLAVGDIDMLTAFVYLNYIRADGTPDVVRLERMEEKYNESYYQYAFPVTCKLTKYPGEVCTWMQIFTGSPSNPTISKTGECILQIEESKNMDDYFCDHQLTALYRLEKSVEEDMADMAVRMTTKADNISYDEDTRLLQLKSGETPVGAAVKVPSDKYGEELSEEVEDTWSDMTDPDDLNAGTESWSPM